MFTGILRVAKQTESVFRCSAFLFDVFTISNHDLRSVFTVDISRMLVVKFSMRTGAGTQPFFTLSIIAWAATYTNMLLPTHTAAFLPRIEKPPPKHLQDEWRIVFPIFRVPIPARSRVFIPARLHFPVLAVRPERFYVILHTWLNTSTLNGGHDKCLTKTWDFQYNHLWQDNSNSMR